MLISQICAETESKLVTIPRLDWLAVLVKAETDDPILRQRIADFVLGATNTSAEFIMCWKDQVQSVCAIVEGA